MIAKRKLPPASVQAYADTNGIPPLSVQSEAMTIARQVSRIADDNRARFTAIKQVSVPVPLPVLAIVEVLARRAGVSRGVMLAQLAKVGASSVLEQLDEAAVGEVAQQISLREQELYDEFDSLIGDES